MVYKFFDKNSKRTGITNESNYQLANELHNPIIRKFKKRKVYSSFKDNIWGVDLADIQSLSRFNKKLIKKNLKSRKYLKEKVINCMLNEKDMIIHLIVGLIKKISYKK